VTAAWDELWNRAKPIVDLAHLKKQGPSWIGPCPLGCARKDGFVVTPAKQAFICRPSGKFGDAVDMEWAPWGGQGSDIDLTVEPGFRKKEAHGQAPHTQH
jgi:hypothetical protein